MHISATLSDKTELGIDLGGNSSIDDVMAILNWITPTSTVNSRAVIDIQVPGDDELDQLRVQLAEMTTMRDHWKGRAENAERHLSQGVPEPLPSFQGKSAPIAQPAAPQPCQEAPWSDNKPPLKAEPCLEAKGEAATGKEPEPDDKEVLIHSTPFTGRSVAWRQGFRACRDYRLALDDADRKVNSVYPDLPANPYFGVNGAKAWDLGYEEAGRYNIDQIPDPDE